MKTEKEILETVLSELRISGEVKSRKLGDVFHLPKQLIIDEKYKKYLSTPISKISVERNLTYLPNELASLPNLRELVLNSSVLEIPKNLSQTKKLQINFDYYIDSKPPLNSKSIYSLKVSGLRNHSTAILFNFLKKFVELRQLDLSENFIGELSNPSKVIFPRVRKLDLSWNQLEELDTLTQIFPNLSHLKLKGNNIKTVDFRNLNNLRCLDLSFNELTQLTKEDLPISLRFLNVSSNSNVKVDKMIKMNVIL